MTEYRDSPESDEPRPFISEDSAVAEGLTELSIRVWSIDPELVTWSSVDAVICLMADLLTASGGQLVAESREILSARFDRQETAVGAARRLQRALQAFAENPETAGFAASIAIHRAQDRARSGTASSISNALWSHSAPGQILVSSTVFETLQFSPGLRFRSLFIDPLGPDVGYQELLWTDAETLVAWRERVETASHASAMSDPHRQPEIGIANAEPRAAGSFADPAVVRLEDEFQISTEVSPRKNRIRFAAGAVSLALVAAIGAVVHFSAGKTHEFPQPPAKIQKIEQPTPPSDKPTVPGNAQKQQETNTQETEPNTVHASVPRNGPKAPHETEAPVKEYEGFTSKQVPQLLRRAEEDAGAGSYDNAKREYEIVLKLQPGNSAAKEGLRKLGMKIGGRR